MNGSIFLIQDNGQLVEMKEEEYELEEVLQELLAKYPNLLAGDQIDRTEPRKWLFVSREVAVPSEEGGAGRWSLDHLFIDQDGIPTLVEVKRSSDTRIRREVVGQMLDYAANGVAYWPIEHIRARFEEHHKDQAGQVMGEFLGEEADPTDFWQKVKANLANGTVRLLFVADEIPPELQRIVEFLNEQMDRTEVLAVEVKQYTGRGLKTLVPRVIGQTTEAMQKKIRSPRTEKPWDEKLFMAEIEKLGRDEARIAEKILIWAKEKSIEIAWGKGKTGTWIPRIEHKGITHSPIAVWSDGRLQISFGRLKEKSPFNDEVNRRKLLTLLNAIPGVNISVEDIGKFPTVPLSTFKDEAMLNQLLKILDWLITEIRQT